MRVSQLFTKTSKNTFSDEESRGTQFLLRAGYIHKEMAGVYDFLPLGKIVLEKIIAIIRQEMDALGANEVSMSALQNKQLWEQSGRFDDKVLDVWFKTQLNAGGEIGLAPTHEEPATALMRSFISSYRDLPVSIYQFQTKFRNELRAKAGILRTREFLMKDLYSFSRDKAEHEAFYEKVATSYQRIFHDLGIGEQTFRTFASGGSFSKFSDEFQTVCAVGEDVIYLDRARGLAINAEIYTAETTASLGLDEKNLEKIKTAEVGNIFTLGYKYAEALGLTFSDRDGRQKPVFMGSYGIGPSRVMGVIAENLADTRGLVWPEKIAPFPYYLIGIGEKGKAEAEKLYAMRPDQFLFDDRDDNTRVGEKFADAELMGIPQRVIISEHSLDTDMSLEIKGRREAEAKLLTLADFKARLS